MNMELKNQKLMIMPIKILKKLKKMFSRCFNQFKSIKENQQWYLNELYDNDWETNFKIYSLFNI